MEWVVHSGNVCRTNLGQAFRGESSPEAKAAAMKALVLDPLLGEAHTALGLLRSHYDYDFPGAQREFLESIQLNPNYANAHLFYAGAYLTPMGRYREAIAEMKKALELDPLSLPLNNYMGNTYLYAEEYDKALQQFRRTIDLDPTFPLAHFFFANLLVDTGKYEQAIKEVQKGELLAGASPEEASAQAAEFQTVSGSMADNPKSWPAIGGVPDRLAGRLTATVVYIFFFHHATKCDKIPRKFSWVKRFVASLGLGRARM